MGHFSAKEIDSVIQQRQAAKIFSGWALRALPPGVGALRTAPCRLRRQALSAIRVAIRLMVRILDPSREFYAARLASGNQPTMVDVSAG